MHQRCSHRFSREATITASKHINDEERIFAMLLILALLFCPSLAEEELGGVKQKKIQAGHTICKEANLYVKKLTLMITKKKKKKKRGHSISTKDPHPSSIALGPLSRSWFSYFQKERSFPFWPVVGEEGFEPPTPWFVATCSNPLSYRPHPVSTGFVPRSTLKKEPFLSPAISG